MSSPARSIPTPQALFFHPLVQRWGRVAWALAAIWLLALVPLWISLIAAPHISVDVGVWGDHAVLQGINGIEEGAGENYRWTTGNAQLALPNLSERYQELSLRAHGWRPTQEPSPVVQMDIAGRPWLTFQTTPGMRVYRVLLPRDQVSAQVLVGLSSQIYSPPDDSRELGFALDWVELGALGSAGPAIWQLAGQATLLALLLVILLVVRLPAWETVGTGAVLVIAVLATNLVQPLWVSLGLAGWLLVALGLLVFNWLAGPLTRRILEPWMRPHQAWLAWALLLAAFAIRLAGAVHPLFDTRDLPVHTSWMNYVTSGELYLYSTPGELHNRRIFNPPAGYVLLAPLWLAIPDIRLVVQVGVALVDAAGCLLVVVLAREFGLRPRAGLLAMAIYLAAPINLTMMWWGFATNAIAQTLWLALLVLLLRLTRQPTVIGLAFFIVVATLGLLTHVGALVLVAATLGLLAVWGWRVLPRTAWAAMVLGALGAVVFALPFYFSLVATPLGDSGPGSLNLAASLAKGLAQRDTRIGLVGQALSLGFLPPLLGAAVPGIALLWIERNRHPLQRTLIGAWLSVCVVFFATYVALALLTRYIYFVTPLICLGAGALLAHLWRSAGGRWLVVALVLLVACVGATLWAGGVLMRIKPSLVPLTQ